MKWATKAVAYAFVAMLPLAILMAFAKPQQFWIVLAVLIGALIIGCIVSWRILINEFGGDEQ